MEIVKVLITGGYGFIGSFVAERFLREGHQVVIIDNISTGNVNNIKFPHTSYILDVESPNCEAVFEQHEIDAVIHLAAQVDIVTSVENPYADTKSNILGLTNMLQLSAKYHVRKFIFASSAAVYGTTQEMPLSESYLCKPVSPYGINKLLGEYYCEKWKELYDLSTLCFRFANVYGPRQGTIGEGGVVSIFMERVRDGKELVIYGTGEQTRDFIYVEDVAEAIFLAAGTEHSGVMNLSTCTENSINTLIEILSELHPSLPSIIRVNSRPGDIYRSVLNNELLRSTINWTPKYSFKEGLIQTYEWFMRESQSLTKKKKTSTNSSTLYNDEQIQNELLGSALSRNIRSLYLSQNELYLEGTPVLKPEIFTAVIHSRIQAKMKFDTNYVLLAITSEVRDNEQLLHAVDRTLRENDYIGLSETGTPQILLSSVSLNDAGIVIERLARQGVVAEVISGTNPTKGDSKQRNDGANNTVQMG